MPQKPNLSAKLSDSAIQDLDGICHNLDISKTEALEQALARFAQELGVRKANRYYLQNIDWAHYAQIENGKVIDAWAVEGAGKKISNIESISNNVRRQLVGKTIEQIKELGYQPVWRR